MRRIARYLAASLCVIILAGCATGPQNPSFSIKSAQAKHDIEKMRDDPKPLDRPLVIIGGIYDPNIWPPIFKHFFGSVTRGGKIIAVSVGFCPTMDDCRKAVIDAVDKACPSNDPQWTSEVDVVGASLGGLVARYAASPSNDPKYPQRLNIARLFTISSPHSGAALVKTAALTDLHRDLIPGSPFLTTLAKYDNDAKYQLVAYVHLDDEIVGDKHAAPPGQTPYWLPNDLPLPPHLAAMIDPRIMGDISRRLRDETPYTQSPPAPLP